MLPVITISREFGSGGHTIGEAVARALNIPFYDSEIVEKVALESGYAKEHIIDAGEYSSAASMWFKYSSSSTINYRSPQDEIFIAQKKVIIDLAQQGPCVIVGRCSDYILRKEGIRCMNVMIHSDMAHRKERVLQRYENVETMSIEKRLQKKDKDRKTYYKFYTDRSWGDYRNYDVSLDSGLLGEDMCVKTICTLAESYQ